MSLEESASRGAQEATGVRPALAARLHDDEVRAFLEALREAGLLSEVDPDELLRRVREASQGDAEARCVTALELYYAAGGDAQVSARRRLADRFFIHREDQPATAAGLVRRLVALVPEIEAAVLERIGGKEGPLVLRAGEHVAAVDDDEDDGPGRREVGVETVTVRGLVRALNVLLERRGVRERLIALRGDDEREIYAGLGVSQALQLTRAGYLEDHEAEDVLELGAW